MAKGTKTRRNLALGAIAAAAASAAAGYYFYASKDAKKHRRIVAKWATDMKRDVVKEAKKLKNIDRAQIAGIIDEAAAAYESAKRIDRKELARAAKELKNNWREIATELAGSSRPTKKAAPKKARKRARRS